MEPKNIAKAAVVAVLLLAAGVMVGRYSSPTKVVTKVETKIVEKEVIKTKETNTRETNKNREYVVIETILPDGTKKIERRYINRDEIREEGTRTNTATSTSSTESRSSTVTESGKADWNISALATMSHKEDDLMKGNFSYGVHIQRRVLGPFSVGVFGITNQTYGLSVGGSF